jgi:hypothetical protein
LFDEIGLFAKEADIKHVGKSLAGIGKMNRIWPWHYYFSEFL